MTIKLNVLRLRSGATLPTYAHQGDAACDLYCVATITLAPGARAQVPTGVAIEIPEGYVGFVWDKSGLSHKHGLKTLGGVIDAGYRGEVMVGLANLGDASYTIEAGHKVAQLVLQKVEHAEVVEVSELSISARGAGGFGSTGK